MERANVHTVFSAECNPTFDWHSVALFHSHRTSGQPGGITRLLACSEEQLLTYQGLDIGPTFVHRNHRGMGGMNYAAFNKPASVKYWTQSQAVPDGVEFVMQLDADMLIHRPVYPGQLGVRPGVVLSAPYNYLVGTTSGLADVFGVRNQSLMARVGGVHVFHISDLRRIAPLWLEFTERVRRFSCEQPLKYFELASPPDKGDMKEIVGRRRQFMWMVEMYGYVFGSAEAGVGRHIISDGLMAYVGSVHRAPGPFIVHYGIDWKILYDKNIPEYSFNKLNYQPLDIASCPRWFFPLPPFSTASDTYPCGPGNALCGQYRVAHQAVKSYNFAMSGKQIADFNDALCNYYARHCRHAVVCPPRDRERVLGDSVCADLDSNCLNWARLGECHNNLGFMTQQCRQSCGLCNSSMLQPMLGDPSRTCFDAAPESECQALAELKACDSQRGYMQEMCRSTCGICNVSVSVDDPRQHRKEDTADHACPDGSDLGGGARSVYVFNNLPIPPPQPASSPQPPPSSEAVSSPVALSASRLEHDARGTPRPEPRSVEATRARKSGRQGSRHAKLPEHPTLRDRELLLLDGIVACWPFLVVQAMTLVLCGYMLRGYLDKRKRRRVQASRTAYSFEGSPGGGGDQVARLSESSASRQRNGQRAPHSRAHTSEQGV